MMKVLILEDAKIGGLALQALKERGIDGSWFISVKSVDSFTLTGLRSDRSEETIRLADYGLAMVDGFLLIDGLMGWDVLPWLKPLMLTVGTSSVGGIGADIDIDKAEMVEKLDTLLETARKFSSLSLADSSTLTAA